jgi:phospholipid/cholesterol/gamma-HCH transport system permease protein
LIRKLNDALGATTIMVTHDIQESLLIVDYIYFMSDGKIVALGTPDEIRASRHPFVHQFVFAEADGPVPFHYPAILLLRNCWGEAHEELLASAGARSWSAIAGLGHRVNDALQRWGLRPVFFSCCWSIPDSPSGVCNLTIREIYFSGFQSLLIIMVSGLFIGMVLGMQGYETLQRYGSAEALGVLVALSLVRELGPVVAALLFASRAGSSITAEIGLMKATEQLTAMDMMAVNPIARVVAPRFWGGVISMPLLAALFSATGVFGGYLIGVVFIGVDEGAFWSQMQASVDFRYDIWSGIVKSFVFRCRRFPDRRF